MLAQRHWQAYIDAHPLRGRRGARATWVIREWGAAPELCPINPGEPAVVTLCGEAYALVDP